MEPIDGWCVSLRDGIAHNRALKQNDVNAAAATLENVRKVAAEIRQEERKVAAEIREHERWLQRLAISEDRGAFAICLIYLAKCS